MNETSDSERGFDWHYYLRRALRRKWYILFPLIAAVFISYGVYQYLPKVYKSSTLILVLPQRVPEAYIKSTVTTTVADRLNTITQEILSRTKLEKTIQELGLYPDLRQTAPMEEVVERMRKSIDVIVHKPQNERSPQNTLSISFQGEEPKTVMMVTNKLASLFIEENLKVREMQAESTSDFLKKELSLMEHRLKLKEEDIRNFREKNMGQLPQQLDANLRILERLQQQMKSTSEGIRATEDRMMLLQNQIDTVTKSEAAPPAREGSTPKGELRVSKAPEDPIVAHWHSLRKDLEIAKSKYRENHPDVLDLQRKVSKLDPMVSEILAKEEARAEAEQKEIRNSLTTDVTMTKNPIAERLLQYREQRSSAVLESKRLREEEKKLEKQMLEYQKRIEETPKKEQELLLLSRDYDLVKANYQSLMEKKMQSQMAENLERKQQGEQFKILDPARIPVRPIRPDQRKILLIGLAIGLASGLGLAWIVESADKSFHDLEDVEDFLRLRVIAHIPDLKLKKGEDLNPAL